MGFLSSTSTVKFSGQALLSVLLIVGNASADEIRFSVIPLSDLANRGNAYDVNAHGEAAGRINVTSSSSNAFYFDSLSTSILPGTSQRAEARGINDSGTIVGRFNNRDALILFPGASAPTQITHSAPIGFNDIGNDNGIAVGWREKDDSTEHEAFYRKANGNLGGLFINQGTRISEIFSINSAGLAVGYQTHSNLNTRRGFACNVIQTPVVTNTGLDPVSSCGIPQTVIDTNGNFLNANSFSEAYAVSDDSYVGGRAQVAGIKRGFFMSPFATKLTLIERRLTDGPQDLDVSRVQGINTRGYMVGMAETSDEDASKSRGFLSNITDKVALDLNSLLSSSDSAQFIIRNAHAINECGTIAATVRVVGAAGNVVIPALLKPVSGSVIPHLPGDVDGDGTVTFSDLNLVLGNFGSQSGGLGDDDADGDVDFDDLNNVLGSFGQTSPCQ